MAPFNGAWARSASIPAQVRTATFEGVALYDLGSGAVRPLERFSNSAYQATGEYDGSVAVWKEYHSPANLDDFSIKVWNRDTGSIETVGGSHRDPRSGEPFPSPWTEPTLGDGYAAWVEGTDASGGGELIVLDTHSGKKRVASQGHPGGSAVIYRGSVIWTESTKPGALTHVFARRLSSWARVRPPRALRNQLGPSSIATDGRSLAWVGADGRSLFYSADGQRARRLVHLSVGGFNPPTVVRGPVVMSVFSGGVIAANSQGGHAIVVRSGGGVAGARHGFLLNTATVAKSVNRTPVAFLGESAVRLQRCN